MYKLAIETEISAAHRLRNYDGPCSRQHGHNWKIRVEVDADSVNDEGMAIDFYDLRNIAWDVVGPFDHNDFNTISPFDTINPSAENISRYFYQEIGKKLPAGIRLNNIRIWENEKYVVEYSE